MREEHLEKITKEELEKINGGAVIADVYSNKKLTEAVVNFIDSIKEKWRGND